MAEDMVKVDLKRTYGKGGKYYGPGTGIEVPAGLARSLGVHPDQQKTKPAPKAAGKKKGAK
jgi:hypothetical protein